MLVVIAIVLVGAVVFLLYPRANKEKQYITFARFRRDTGVYIQECCFTSNECMLCLCIEPAFAHCFVSVPVF